MHIYCVYNPSSGRAKGKRLAKELEAELIKNGQNITLAQSQAEIDQTQTQEIAKADILVVVGGDGTLANYIEICAKSNTAIAFLGAGNECLTSQLLNLTKTPKEFVKVLNQAKYIDAYYGFANSKAFFHVLSIGLDACIVRYVAEKRRKKISNLLYVLAWFSESLQYKRPEFNIEIDGEIVAKNCCGSLVVASSSSYAGGISPVPEASYDKDVLYLRYFPKLSPRHYMLWGIAYILKRKLNLDGTRLFSGKNIKITGSSGSNAVQIDGEYLGVLPVSVRRSQDKVRFLIA